MKLRHRLAAVATMGLLTTCTATVALSTSDAPASLATGGTIIVENGAPTSADTGGTIIVEN